QIRVVDGTGVGTPLLGGGQAGWHTRWPAWKPDGTGLLFLSPDRVCTCEDPQVQKVYQVDTAAGLPVTAAPGLLLAEDRDVGAPTWLVDGSGQPLVVSRTTAPTRSTATLQDIRPDGTDPRDLGVSVLREDPGAVSNPALLFHPGPGFDPWHQREEYSPDGRTIAVSRYLDDGGVRAQRIWLVDADGSNPRERPVGGRQPGDCEVDQAWSPDSRFLAFVRQSPGGVLPGPPPPNAVGQDHIVVVDVATGAVTGTLVPPPGVADQQDTQPAWSPDGTTISFSRGTITETPTGEVRRNHIWTARAGTLDQQRDISQAVCGSDCAVADDSSAFSPDGRSIAFNRENDGLLQVSLADTGCQVLLPPGQTSCAGPLTAGPAGPFQPRDVAYSPDGSQLVLTTRRAGDPASPEALAVLDLATGALNRIDWDLPGRQKEPTFQQAVDLAVQAPPEAPAALVSTPSTVTLTVINRGPAPSPGSVLTVAVPPGVRLDALRPATG